MKERLLYILIVEESIVDDFHLLREVFDDLVEASGVCISSSYVSLGEAQVHVPTEFRDEDC